MNYGGIDHHKQYSHITLLDAKGKKLKSGRVANYRSEKEPRPNVRVYADLTCLLRARIGGWFKRPLVIHGKPFLYSLRRK